jgi:hypothetical protein
MPAGTTAADAELASFLREAEQLELSESERLAYARASQRSRAMLKARAHKRLRTEARALSVQPERFLRATVAQRAELRQRAAAQGGAEQLEPDEAEPELDTAPGHGEIPETDPDPRRRDHVSLDGAGIEDVSTKRPPRTLADVYARWPMLGRTGGDEFYLRVERKYPLKSAGVDVAGPLGEIRVVCNEDEFGHYFGSGQYALQVFGPDPKRRRDADGALIIKALCDPFPLTVPGEYGPTRLHGLPRSAPRAGATEAGMFPPNPLNPFGPNYPLPQPPTTAADAAMHKSSLEFASSMINSRLREGDGATRSMVTFLEGTAKQQLDAVRADADKREQLLREQVQRAEQQTAELRREFAAVQEQLDQQRGNRSAESLEFAKLREGGAERLHEHYQRQEQALRGAYDVQIRGLKELHVEELNREHARTEDQRTYYTRQLEEQQRRFDEREKALREEVERVRREERERATERTGESEKNAERRLSDERAAHQRELRSVAESHESRLQTATAKLDFEITHLRERLAEADKRVDEARAAAEKAKDPIAAVKELKQQARQLGMEEPEPDAPKGVLAQFASAAGSGLGQALGNTNLAELLGAVRSVLPGARLPAAPGRGPAPAQLAPGRQEVRGPSARSLRWASAESQSAGPPPRSAELGGAMLVGPPVPASERTPAPAAPVQVGGESVQPPAPGVQKQAANVQPPAPSVQGQPVQSPPAPEPSPPEPAAAVRALPEHRLIQTFGAEVVLDFIGKMEGAINAAYDPRDFGRLFVQSYPQAARRLALEFQPEDAVQLVASVPEALQSPVLRRDGKQWLQQLWRYLTESAAPAPPAAAD